ncbi:not available [Pontoporia blainvillei]|uniref:Not available n=1 Tax=Pontoporia blainvillei TaxID=48723 RepID=A0ABX0S3R3_PONBL|nr:not available [Pontoporia blainvillei]
MRAQDLFVERNLMTHGYLKIHPIIGRHNNETGKVRCEMQQENGCPSFFNRGIIVPGTVPAPCKRLKMMVLDLVGYGFSLTRVFFCQVQNAVVLVADRAPSYVTIAKYGSSAGVFPLLCVLPGNAINKLYEYGLKSSECLADLLGLLKGSESSFNASRNHLKGRVIGLLYLSIVSYQRSSALQYTLLSVFTAIKIRLQGEQAQKNTNPRKFVNGRNSRRSFKIL